MIGYFPKLYADELVYSYLARLSLYNGYLTYRQAAEDIFGEKLVNPSIEFTNPMLPEVKQGLTGGGVMEAVVLEHTMFPYYGEFMDRQRKAEAFASCAEGKGSYYRMLPLPKRNQKRFLRYCPACAENDRRELGETYWHRNHQLSGINVCSIHGCFLCDSEVLITSDKTPEFVTAQSQVKYGTVPLSGSEIEIMLAGYMEKLLEKAGTLPETSIADCLNSQLSAAGYLSRRGSIRKIADLSRDFVEYYRDMEELQPLDVYRCRLEKILNGKRIHFLEICQLAMFLNISPTDLAERRSAAGISCESAAKHFDKRVTELLKDGAAINEIARRLSISSKTVRDIRDRKFAGDKKSARGRGGRKRKDWVQTDRETLPFVQSVLGEMQEKKGERPVRITCSGVARRLNLHKKYFQNLPLCRDEIKRYEVSFEEYWAKEVEWAMQHIQKENLKMNWKQIRNLTNLNRANFQRCLPYLEDANVAEICKSL